jgi:hypothetical protein
LTGDRVDGNDGATASPARAHAAHSLYASSTPPYGVVTPSNPAPTPLPTSTYVLALTSLDGRHVAVTLGLGVSPTVNLATAGITADGSTQLNLHFVVDLSIGDTVVFNKSAHIQLPTPSCSVLSAQGGLNDVGAACSCVDVNDACYNILTDASFQATSYASPGVPQSLQYGWTLDGESITTIAAPGSDVLLFTLNMHATRAQRYVSLVTQSSSGFAMNQGLVFSAPDNWGVDNALGASNQQLLQGLIYINQQYYDSHDGCVVCLAALTHTLAHFFARAPR